MKPDIRRSISGVEGLPLEMIIILIVLAMILPISFSYFNTWNTDRTEQTLLNEIDYLATRIKMVYLTGENNTDMVDFTLSNGLLAEVESVSIGLDPSKEIDGQKVPTGITYKLSGRPEQTILVQDPEIPMAFKEGDSFDNLELGSGRHTIYLEVKKDPAFSKWVDGIYVEVSVVD